MTPKMKRLVLALLKDHNLMSIATVRPDGFPQSTTVTYANDGFDLYFLCDKSSQKARNLAKCPKVSLTIDRDCTDWSKIRGLSMAATARVVSRPADRAHGLALLARKFPAMRSVAAEELEGAAVVKVTPKVVSVIDYTRGFGHTDLVRI